MPLHYTIAVGNVLTAVASKKANHICVLYEAIHFWRKGLSYADVLSHIDYESHGDVPTSRQWWRKQGNEIPRLTHAEKLYVTDPNGDSGEKSRILRPEQKSSWLMKDIVRKVSKSGEVVVELFSGTFATAKTCL